MLLLSMDGRSRRRGQRRVDHRMLHTSLIKSKSGGTDPCTMLHPSVFSYSRIQLLFPVSVCYTGMIHFSTALNLGDKNVASS